MQARIDPKVDYAFKWLFGKEQNLPLLINFLNAILKPEPENMIVELELLNPFSQQDSADDKLSIVDVKARDLSGRHFDIEMQLFSRLAYANRILFYWSDLHQQQLVSGASYESLRPTISICINNFVLFPQTNEYCLPFELCNRKHNLVFSSDILIIVLELPKFRLEPEELKTPLDTWLYFLRHAEQLDSNHLPATLKKPEIRKALEELIMLSQDDLERERYKARLRVQRDEQNFLATVQHLKQQLAAEQQRIASEQQRIASEQQRIASEQQRIASEQQRLDSARAESLEQGTKQGRADEAVSIVMRQLSRRFGSVELQMETQIRKLSLTQVEQLVEELLDFASMDDLSQWLGNL